MSAVDHPKHYTAHESGVECIDICERLDFCTGNAVKYLWRSGLKDATLQDLQKAAWYLRRISNTLGDSRRHVLPPITLRQVIEAEPEGSVLGDVLKALFRDGGNVSLAHARVEREIERVQEGA